jgi:hypothetical protein
MNRNLVASLLIVLGLAAVSVGAGLVFAPAGVIVGGLASVALGVLVLGVGDRT